MPIFGNNRLAINAPAIPTIMSPMMPKPVPRTILPASQPATRPTNRMTKMPSLDSCMNLPLARGSLPRAVTVAMRPRRDDPNHGNAQPGVVGRRAFLATVTSRPHHRACRADCSSKLRHPLVDIGRTLERGADPKQQGLAEGAANQLQADWQA